MKFTRIDKRKRCFTCKKLINPKLKFCSNKCNRIVIVRNNHGKNHWNWKGGITTKNEKLRQKFTYTIQKEVLKRDNYTCQMCGSKKDLQVDHIQSWSEYVELRFSMDNCRTLCSDCHYLITYGKPKPEGIKIWGTVSKIPNFN